jgi:predicted transcriptional regulator
MAPRRTPSTIALELLDCVEANVEATKWDLIKVLGNDAQFRLWVDDFLLAEGVLSERRDGAHHIYTKTERGELLHRLLKTGYMLRIIDRVSGRKLR